jgi:hypothetical protein
MDLDPLAQRDVVVKPGAHRAAGDLAHVQLEVRVPRAQAGERIAPAQAVGADEVDELSRPIVERFIITINISGRCFGW